MRIILAIIIMALVVGTACNDAGKPEVEPSPAAAELNTIIQRIEALETAAAAPSPEPIQTASSTPPPTPAPTATTPPIMAPTAIAPPIIAPTATALPTPAPTATLSPTPIPVGREDICYRALPVQDALLNKFSDTYLCAAVQLGELFRITELRVEARGHLLKRTDFADMPNLKQLEVGTDLEGLAPDVFHSLSGLSGLRLTFDMYYSNGETLPSDLLNGLPSGLEWLELRIVQPPSGDNEKQAIDLPSDLFSSVPHIKRLAISLSGSGRGWHLEFGPRTLAGLSNLESLELRGPLAAIPRELLADLQSLEMLTLSNTAVFGGPHILYFPTVEMLVKFGKYCNDTDFCVTGGIIEQ